MKALFQYVIYHRPKDLPQSLPFWVRRWRIEGGAIFPEVVTGGGNTIEEARRSIPPDLYNLGRQPGDDPVIAEVWI
jgi:hypothetical protein